MFNLFLRARAHNYFKNRLGDQSFGDQGFKARSADRDAGTDRSRIDAVLQALRRKRAGKEKIEAVFIRAPVIRETRPGVKVLARYKGDPVLVEQGRHMAATFHPELTSDLSVHTLFLEKL